MIGEPSYEVGAALRNSAARFTVPSIIERRVGIFCERLGFNRRRVLGWAFAQAVLSAVWQVEAGDAPTGVMTAEAVLQLL